MKKSGFFKKSLAVTIFAFELTCEVLAFFAGAFIRTCKNTGGFAKDRYQTGKKNDYYQGYKR